MSTLRVRGNGRRGVRTAVLVLAVMLLAVLFATTASAAVWTDQQDYAPGSVVTLSGDNSDGAGYLAGETVLVEVQGPNGYTASCTAVAGQAGAWSCQVTLWASVLAVGDYTYTATGQTSGVAQNGVFSDSVSYGHTCALTTDGGTKCWGWNNRGQLGDNSTTTRLTPVDVVGLSSGVAQISTGGYHTCALTTGGGVKCWGYNAYGQLGDGSTTQRLTPVDVAGLSSGVTQISAGFHHTCALTTGGGVKCWGYNDHGQLGDNSTTQRLTPVDVAGLSSGVAQISAGSYHNCALTTGGGAKCWGWNFRGQLGDNSTTQRLTPVDVAGLAGGMAQISSGYFHTCALTTAGGGKCWGYNFYGELGDGSTTTRLTPVDVTVLAGGVARISMGYDYACALTTGGGVKCWGNNTYGELGDGSVTNRLTPVDVAGLAGGVAQINASYQHMCALTTGGGVKCWGYNVYGQLGDGSTTTRLTPVDVVGLAGGVFALPDNFTPLFNQPPTAVPDTYAVNEGQALAVPAPGVLDNDGDPDSDPLTAVLVDDVDHGLLALAGDGSFSYTPAAGYSGPDSFTYLAHDGTADSNIATVDITVNAVTATLTLAKETDPDGGRGFPFTLVGEVGGWGSFGSDPGLFNEPGGVAIDADNNVFIIDLRNARIQKFDSTGAYLMEPVSSIIANDVAVDGAGSIFVLDPTSVSYGITKFSSDGAPIASANSFRSNGVAVDRTGNVYVANTWSHRVQKFDNDLKPLAAWGSYGSGNGEFISPGGIAVYDDGTDVFVYVADTGNGRIQKFDRDGGYMTQWGSLTTRFRSPGAVDVDPAGNVYVADSGNRSIQKFDSMGTFLTSWSGVAPRGLAVDPGGHIYVTENHRVRVFVDKAATLDDDESVPLTLEPGTYDVRESRPASWAVTDILCDSGSPQVATNKVRVTLAAGDNVTCTFTNTSTEVPPVPQANLTLAKETDPDGGRGFPFTLVGEVGGWGSFGSDPGQFNEPLGVAIDADNNVFVVDFRNARVQEFDSTGAYILEQVSSITATDVAVDGAGSLFVLNPTTVNNDLTKFSSDGTPIAWANSFRSNGVAVDRTGNVYVANTWSHQVQKFDNDLRPLTAWGSYGSGNGEFASPGGIAVYDDGTDVFVYVADTGNDRIQKFDSDGGYLTQWGSLTTGFSSPGAVDVDPAGNVYVADSGNGSIQKFDSMGTFLTSWSGVAPRGLAVDAGGHIYVTENHRVRVFVDKATTLDDDGAVPFALEPGTYDIRETPLENWEMTAVSCNGGSPQPGTDMVKVTLASDDDVSCTFTNLSLNQPPTAAAGGPYTVPEGGSVALDGSASTDPDPADTLAYDWDLDNDGVFELPGVSPTFSAALLDGPGSATVALRVTDSGALIDVDTAVVTITNVAPTVRTPVVDPEPSAEGGQVSAAASFTDPAPDDSPFSCTVDYGAGDGPQAGTVSGSVCSGPAYTYADDGSYPVTVTVTDKDGDPGSASATHDVTNVAPTVRTPVVDPEPSDEGGPISATASFTDPAPDDSPFSCTVDYGAGDGPQAGTVSGSVCSGPAYTYADDGSYPVTVTVTDKDGDPGRASATHNVANVAPTVRTPVVDPEPSDEGGQVSATASFTDPAPDDSPFSCTVDYGAGDGPQAGTVNGSVCSGPAYTYADDGTYPVTVTVTDKDGDAGSASATHNVSSLDACPDVPGNLLQNYCFEDGPGPWTFWTDGAGTYVTSSADPYQGQFAADVAIKTAGGNVQLYQKDIALKPDTIYELSFAAYSSNGRDLSVYLQQHGDPYTNYGLKDFRADLTTGWGIYSTTFTTTGFESPVTDGRLRFWMAPFDVDGMTYRIDWVVLREVDAGNPPIPPDPPVIVPPPGQCNPPIAGNLIANPGFESGTTAWTFFTDGTGAFANAAVDPYECASNAKVSISKQGTNVQLYQQPITLQGGETYVLRLAARSSGGQDVKLFMHKHEADYDNYGLNGIQLDLTNNWQVFVVEFTAKGSVPLTDARLRLWLGPFDQNGASFEFDDLLLLPRSEFDALATLTADAEKQGTAPTEFATKKKPPQGQGQAADSVLVQGYFLDGDEAGRLSGGYVPENGEPWCYAARPSIAALYAADGRFVQVRILGVGNPTAVRITSIFQNEQTGPAPDGTGLGKSSAQVRAERDEGGEGRVYRIAFTAAYRGRECSGSVVVGVPVNRATPATAGSYGYDSTAATP